MAITFSNIGLAEPSTLTKVVASVVIARGSTNEHQEVLVIGDPSDSLAMARVLAAKPASTEYAQVVRNVETVFNIGSTAADNAVTVGNSRINIGSTAADNVVTLGSINAAAGRINIGSTATDNVVRAIFSSTNTDNPVRAILSSTSADNPVNATLLFGGLQSSVAGSSGSSGVLVRPIIDAILTTASTNAFAASTSLSIQSSGAALRSYVVAYSCTSTNAGPHKLKFYSSGTMTWPFTLAAVSSAISGVNLAVSAPAYIFRTAASEALTLQLGSGASTVGGYQVAVSYFRAP